jgi:hypothetical protein
MGMLALIIAVFALLVYIAIYHTDGDFLGW